jgi:hypothetical protein
MSPERDGEFSGPARIDKMDGPMDALTRNQQAALTECLRALDSGAGMDECLARYPADSALLRPYLELRARLRDGPAPEPPPLAYQAGRQALVDRVTAERQDRAASSGIRRSIPAGLLAGWRSLPAPLAAAAAVIAVLVLGGGVLGAASAAGVPPARDVLSALRIVDNDGSTDEAASNGAGAPDEDAAGQGDTVPPVEPPVAPPHEVPGLGLCFAGGLPEGVPEGVQLVPAEGVCVAPGLLEQDPQGRACVPPALLDRFPELADVVSSDGTCPRDDEADSAGPADARPVDAGPPDDPGPPDGSGPTDGVPAGPSGQGANEPAEELAPPVPYAPERPAGPGQHDVAPPVPDGVAPQAGDTRPPFNAAP